MESICAGRKVFERRGCQIPQDQGVCFSSSPSFFRFQFNSRNISEKKKSNNTFDLSAAVHEAEIPNLKPGIDPDHRFEVSLDSDSFTEEKFALFVSIRKQNQSTGTSSDMINSGELPTQCTS